MIKLASSNRNPIQVVNDQFGQPTSAQDLAQLIIECFDTDIKPGIYHATNDGETNWYLLAKEVLKLINEDPDKIIPIKSEQLNRLAPRPSYSVLSHECWQFSKVKPLRHWQEALADQIHEIKSAVLREEIDGA